MSLSIHETHLHSLCAQNLGDEADLGSELQALEDLFQELQLQRQCAHSLGCQRDAAQAGCQQLQARFAEASDAQRSRTQRRSLFKADALLDRAQAYLDDNSRFLKESHTE